jgi:peptide/nickel transport system permease protein
VASYLLRRVAAGVAVLFVASFLMFLLVSLSGNPLPQLQANPQISRATIEAARVQLHLNEPLLQRYWLWLDGFGHGSFADSALRSVSGFRDVLSCHPDYGGMQ